MLQKIITHYLDDSFSQGRIYDIFVPEKIQHDTAIFMIHGGGWKAGSRTEYHGPIIKKILEQGFIVATTDYRLDVSVFDQLKDCRDAYMHFANELRQMERPLKIAVFGCSAGAHLASLLITAEPGAAGESFTGEWIVPVCGMLQSVPKSFEPWDEILPYLWKDMQFAVRTPYHEDPELYKKLSFERHIHPGMPRLFFMEAEYEEMFWYPEKLELARDIAAFGNEISVKIYKNMEHGFLYNLDRVHQREALDDLLKFVKGEKIDGLEFKSGK